jgi:hypothetical protein
MDPKYTTQIHTFVTERYADFCNSADQHDDHKQTLTELAESAAVVDILQNALIEAQTTLNDAKQDIATWLVNSGMVGASDTIDGITKALATITEALKEVDE